MVDVLFEHNNLPDIKDALEVDNAGKRCVMEVAQHIGNDTVRCIMLASSEGLYLSLIHISAKHEQAPLAQLVEQ